MRTIGKRSKGALLFGLWLLASGTYLTTDSDIIALEWIVIWFVAILYSGGALVKDREAKNELQRRQVNGILTWLIDIYTQRNWLRTGEGICALSAGLASVVQPLSGLLVVPLLMAQAFFHLTAQIFDSHDRNLIEEGNTPKV